MSDVLNKLMNELSFIQKKLYECKSSKESHNVISEIGEKAYNDYAEKQKIYKKEKEDYINQY